MTTVSYLNLSCIELDLGLGFDNNFLTVSGVGCLLTTLHLQPVHQEVSWVAGWVPPPCEGGHSASAWQVDIQQGSAPYPCILCRYLLQHSEYDGLDRVLEVYGMVWV